MMEITTDSLYAAGDGGEGGPVKMVIEVVEAGFVGKLLAAQGDTVEVCLEGVFNGGSGRGGDLREDR